MNELAVSLTRIADCIEPVLNSPFCTALLTLAGVYLGSRLNYKAAFRQEQYHMMIESYAVVLSLYPKIFTENNSEESIVELSCAIDRARLLSPPKIEKILINISKSIIVPKPDPKQCGLLADQLHTAIKEELRNYNR